ncbi:MAG TPA: Npt1/Npt2 family nucleotide transporter [Terriglobia bacterium]|nr:Npt1/Npt2 family nucleotide transporter [Terriglobia bacterium]
MIERLLHLRPGDFRRGLPLFSYYFLIIASSQVGQIARDALVLDRFSALQLPYLDISVSLLIGFVVAFYIRLSRRTSLRNLLLGSLCFYVLTVGALWWAIHFYQPSWVYLFLYVWVGIVGALAPAQVWTLANFVWTTREAKRLFGMLGSGGILGGIFAGFVSARITSSFGAESLLLLMAIPLASAAWIVISVWEHQPETSLNKSAVKDSGPQNLIDSLRLIAESPHLRAIATLVFLSSVVATIAAWQMKAIAQATFVSKDALAVFFGQFDGYVCVVALVAQLFLTGKVLQKFGIGTALAALPIFLFAGSATVVVSGSLWAVCLAKGSDRVFRYSIDTAAQQLLYLPVSSRVKLQVKSFIDTVIWRFGGGFAGLVLLIFATRLGLSPSEVGWLSLLFISLWMATAFAARRQYIATLGENIRQIELDEGDGLVPVLDVTTSNILMTKLRSTESVDILHALNLYEMGQHQQVLGAVKGLLDHPAPSIRAKAISVLRESADTSAHAMILKLLHDDNLEVRTEALSYLSVHDHIDPIASIAELGKFRDFSICSATIAFLARPGEAQNIDAARVMLAVLAGEPGEPGMPGRRAAAQLIGALPDYFEAQLESLLRDEDAEVVKHALRSFSSLRKHSLIPLVIERLEDPSVSTESLEALAALEDSILDTLSGYLEDSTLRIEVRRRIPDVLLQIGTPQASRALADNILQADCVLRFRIIYALNKLQELYKHPTLDRGLIETVMVAEIMGHYRSYQILGSLRNHADELLRPAMGREVERIFRLMKLLFPSIDLQNAYRGIQSRDHAAHANALEFLENTLSPTVRTLLLPLIDSEVSVAERIRRADTFLNTRVVSHEQAIAALVHSEDPWLKSSGVYAIGKLGSTTFNAELERLARDKDPLLQKNLAEARAMLGS